MKKSLIFCAAILLGGCATNSTIVDLSPSPQGARISADACVDELPFKYLGGGGEYSKVSLTRNYWQYGDEVIIKEHGMLDSNYQFSVSIDSLVGYSFELVGQKIFPLTPFHTYYEGTSRRTKESVYIISSSGTFESFDLLYSDRRDTIYALAQCIKTGAKPTLAARSSAPLSQEPQRYIRDDFSPVFFMKYDVIMSKGDRDFYLK
jgi:hypothetical protein